MKQVISTEQAPAAIGPYSQAISVGEVVYASGQIPLTPSGELMAGDAATQFAQCLSNAQAILAAAGLSLHDVVKTTIFLTEMADFAAVNEVYAQHFSEPYPARSTVAVRELPKGAKVEIEVIAHR